MVSKRRKLREAVVKALFQLDFRPDEFEDILRDTLSDEKIQEVKKDVERYLKRIRENRERIDEIISKYLLNWDFGRVSYIDRNILRLGAYELLYEMDVPIEVTLDEMVEIAKKYGSEESGKFVNGVLDKIAKTEAPKEKFDL
ncbi:transcription antitermination factor NusB [Fervidobacterium pennivorans DSM 9078]|uniref:Transcription antitermination protein NusB n=1 Tax=Fervidobacterium pennivorans (strain DSM 9078 / Ven5) TaxID=771875 RepID=H9UAD2_FERPD|nr:transcription antitermination factor NusB [Fervidobacterium pennivorans]AFG34475.1 transcription antitermination factor NusB [Fervidobacterium pennivorans DSM 9078]QIV77813.1 transcription antitermination factor NusB [Fervidobacterium pennivorans subsp. keratinolyticus]